MDRPSLLTISALTVLAGMFIGIGAGALTPSSFYAQSETAVVHGVPNEDVDVAGAYDNRATISTFCPDNHYWYESDDVSFCYPQMLTQLQDQSTDALFFFAPHEELFVEFTSQRNVPLHICNRARDVTVAGKQAVRTAFYEPLEEGCGDALGYVTIVETGSTPLFIRMSRTDGTSLPLHRYEAVEESFVIE